MLNWSEADLQQESHLRIEAPYCIDVDKVRVLESVLVSYHHQYEVLYRLWGGLLRQPQALCEYDRPLFYFSTASLCSLGQKKDSPQLMTKGCPPKVKISCRQLEELQRQTLTFTKSLIYLIRSFSLHWFLVTKVSLGFREVILKCTAQKVQTGRLVGKPFRGQFEERCNALNFSHHPSQRRGRLVL